MKSFKERYVAAYSQMLEVLEELCERALKFQRTVDPKSLPDVRKLYISHTYNVYNLDPEKKDYFYFTNRNGWQQMSCGKQDLLDEDLEGSALRRAQKEKDQRKQQAAEARERKQQRINAKEEKEKKLLVELKAKYEY